MQMHKCQERTRSPLKKKGASVSGWAHVVRMSVCCNIHHSEDTLPMLNRIKMASIKGCGVLSTRTTWICVWILNQRFVCLFVCLFVCSFVRCCGCDVGVSTTNKFSCNFKSGNSEISDHTVEVFIKESCDHKRGVI